MPLASACPGRPGCALVSTLPAVAVRNVRHILRLMRSSGWDLPSPPVSSWMPAWTPAFLPLSFTPDNERAVAALRGWSLYAKHCGNGLCDGTSHPLLQPTVSRACSLPRAPGSPWPLRSSYLPSFQAGGLVRAAWCLACSSCLQPHPFWCSCSHSGPPTGCRLCSERRVRVVSRDR